MKSVTSLTVLMPAVPGQLWSCHSCGDCCRTLVGHLTDEEKRRIEAQDWESELGVQPVVRAGRQWVLNKRADGACVFLDDKNLCMIHARFGEAAKPLACRIFPFSVRPTERGMQVSLRFDCPSVTSSLGEPLRQHRDLVRELSDQLSSAAPADRIRLKGRLLATSEEVSGVVARLEKWLCESAIPFNVRIQVMARLVSILHGAKLRRVRGKRLLELIDLLLGVLPAEITRMAPAPPTPRQQSMLRQFAFACSEHVSLAELTAGWRTKLSLRKRQITNAKQFLRGEGAVPSLRGIEGSATFADVARVSPATAEQEKINELLPRYVLARLAGSTVFGAGYYGWPMIQGLGALCLSIAAVGWLARYRAAAEHRPSLSFDDVARAIGIVDRAATRVPILGRFSERARVTYFMENDGLARAVAEFALTKQVTTAYVPPPLPRGD